MFGDLRPVVGIGDQGIDYIGDGFEDNFVTIYLTVHELQKERGDNVSFL